MRLAIGAEFEVGDELLGEGAARAFGNQRVFAVQRHAAHKFALRLAVAADAEVSGCDAGHVAFAVREDLGAGKARIDFDAQLLGLGGKPPHHVAKAHNIVALVRHQRRHQEMGYVDIATGSEIEKAVFGDVLRHGRASLPPVGKQSVEADRIDDRAGKDVGAGFRALSSTTTEISVPFSAASSLSRIAADRPAPPPR